MAKTLVGITVSLLKAQLVLNPKASHFHPAGQDGRQVSGGTWTNHDFSEVQHPEILPGSGHHTLCSPCRHGCQRLLRPLRQNVSMQTLAGTSKKKLGLFYHLQGADLIRLKTPIKQKG